MGLFGKKQRRELNLIPEEQQEIKQKQNLLGLVIFMAIVAVSLALTFLGLFFLQNQEKAQGRETEAEVKNQISLWQKEASAAADLAKIKAKYSTYKTFLSSQPQFEKKLALISEKLPSKVQLTNLSIDESGKVQITAKAETTAVVYQLLEIFKGEASFKDVVLSGLAKGELNEVTFNLSLTIK